MRSIASNRVLSILGGGQLGRMLIQKAIDFNVTVRVLDPSDNAPCKDICSEFVVGDFNDYQTVMDFGRGADILTVEIEHVSVKALEDLERSGVKVFPQPSVLKIVQDKGVQKQFYKDHGIPTSEFVLIDGDISNHTDMFPVMQKLRTSGYDGRGVVALKDPDDLSKAFSEPSVLEKFIDFDKEISVIVSRNENGELSHFPVVELEFNAEANLVEFLFSPSTLTPELEERAVAIAEKVINELEMVGLLAVEMFVTKDGNVLVNEIAPRPHNSGHQSIEGNISSQYENHLRAIFNMPAGDTSVIKPSVMVNLLGEKGYNGPAVYEGLDEVLRIPGSYIHLYGKHETRPFRKMGHVTVLGDSLEDASLKAKRIQEILRIIA
jgi:5-(carboxyamino)imidazole ribonucleotide synthase